MVEYLVEQEKRIHPGKLANIKLIPVYSIRPGRVANTEDTIEDFYINHAQHFPTDTLVIFVSNNSQGLHYIPFQDAIAKETLKRLGTQQLTIITVGRGANNISLSAATDAFARMFYTKRPRIIDEIKNAQELPLVADTKYARLFTQPTEAAFETTVNTSSTVLLPAGGS